MRLTLFRGILISCVLSSASAQAQLADVPFQGCKSDGQVLVPAPSKPARPVQIDAVAARRLTYYKAEYGSGVLGPRGWNCVGIVGSSGSTLLVTPSPINTETWESVSSSAERARAGIAIEVNDWSGDTSGRHKVASVAARVFPLERAYVQSVTRESVSPASDYTFGPYPTDRLVYRGDRIVEYETPARLPGLGTMGRLSQSGDVIRGVAILRGNTPDLVLLAARLPANMTNLAPIIIQQLEKGN